MKKVLIITYYWPPAGGPGVQRVLKFVKYLPQFGWEPIILTVEKGNYPSIDNTLVNEIPENIKVYKTPIFEPFEIYQKFSGSKSEKIPTFELNKEQNENWKKKIFKWIRGNLFIPDAKIGWINHIYKEGLKIVESENPDIIFSSSPPHSLQIGAFKLAAKTGIKWVADFRDPWSSAFWQKDLARGSFAKKRDSRFEHRVISNANAIVTVGKGVKEEYLKTVKRNIEVIPNGFDETDFEVSVEKNKNKFIISYTGTLGQSQKIDNLLESLNKLPDEVSSNININFYGTFHPSISATIEKYNLGDLINIHSGVSHTDVVKIMKSSNALLLVIPDSENNKGIITGKLFEYLASGNFILGIGPENGDASEILSETYSGKMFDYDKDMTDEILKLYTNWKNSELNEANSEAVNKFSRKELTKKLARLFEEVYEA